MNLPDTSGMIVCPHCDALYRVHQPEFGQRAVCARCHSVLITPRRNAMLRIVALSVTNLILVVAALFLPFLRISRSGFFNQTSLMDAVLAFSKGPLFALSLAVGALIVLVPVLRMVLSIYVLAPLAFDRPPWQGARRAFRLFEALKPWSMAEIFVLGCAVALVKVSALAQVSLGAAFWMMGALVIIVLLQDNLMCRWSVWDALERRT